jgi:hypothetical protein
MKENKFEQSKIAKLSFWLSLAGIFVFIIFVGLVISRSILSDSDWLINIIKGHFAATVGLPLAMVAAIVIVSLFKLTFGPIELEIIGFKFKGASGQVILWIVVFLSMASAIKLLW